jgi:hypothetical protein
MTKCESAVNWLLKFQVVAPCERNFHQSFTLLDYLDRVRSPGATAGPMNLLIVEDEKRMAELLRKGLEEEGHADASNVSLYCREWKFWWLESSKSGPSGRGEARPASFR